MTISEFEQSSFSSKDLVIYKGVICRIISLDFEEYLIGISANAACLDDSCEITWVRCENVEYIFYKKNK